VLRARRQPACPVAKRQLDQVGHDLEPQAVSEGDGRADDRRVVGIVDHPEHERHVDLDLVDRKLLQVRERRVAGSEVVDRDLDPEGADRMQACEHLRGV